MHLLSFRDTNVSTDGSNSHRAITLECGKSANMTEAVRQAYV